jgi:hypothetical protein
VDHPDNETPARQDATAATSEDPEPSSRRPHTTTCTAATTRGAAPNPHPTPETPAARNTTEADAPTATAETAPANETRPEHSQANESRPTPPPGPRPPRHRQPLRLRLPAPTCRRQQLTQGPASGDRLRARLIRHLRQLQRQLPHRRIIATSELGGHRRNQTTRRGRHSTAILRHQGKPATRPPLLAQTVIPASVQLRAAHPESVAISHDPSVHPAMWDTFPQRCHKEKRGLAGVLPAPPQKKSDIRTSCPGRGGRARRGCGCGRSRRGRRR